VLPAILVVGVSFSVTQYFWSNHVDSNLVDIASAIVSIIVTIVFLRFWETEKNLALRYDKPELTSPRCASFRRDRGRHGRQVARQGI